MSDIVIKAESLGKKYIIGHQAENGRYVALRDVLMQNARGFWHKTKDLVQGKPIILGDTLEEVWALKDVSFEIQRGEVVGIIGRNGAGKSTLLKILSRITEPSAGRVTIKGRVASLLEVGTGFHPELTGRQNIYLNGAILGMTRAEIKRKFDEIVSFAEIEKFLDTPVKRYSSGMYVRLAFAVAAHLEPEILVVDEVLAVGDAAFQKKCLSTMGDIARRGRTVLFVSHNMLAIRNLCQDAILLHAGRIVERGAAATITEHYLQDTLWQSNPTDVGSLISALPDDPLFRFHSIAIRQDGLPINGSIVNGKPVELGISYEVLHKVAGFRVFVALCDGFDDVLVQSFNDEDADEVPVVLPGRYVSTVIIPADFLAPRQYNLIVGLTVHNVRSYPPGGIAIPLSVARTGRFNRAYVDDPVRGKLAPVLEWHTTTRTPIRSE